MKGIATIFDANVEELRGVIWISLLHMKPTKIATHGQCEVRNIGISVIDVFDNSDCGFTGPVTISVSAGYSIRLQIEGNTYAEPFFVLIRSAISRLRPR